MVMLVILSSLAEKIIFLLNGFVFLLIGLQVPDTIDSLGNYSIGQLINYELLISAAAILVRIVWVAATGTPAQGEPLYRRNYLAHGK